MRHQASLSVLQSTTNRTTKPITTNVDGNNVPHKRPSGPSLRDEDGFCYFGPVDQIDAILNVNNYVHVVPLAPLEELHASSVQHPSFPDMRWLLNTRRVPVLPSGSGDDHAKTTDDSAEDTRPSCAGVGDAEAPSWLCHHCAAHLCQQTPRISACELELGRP